MGNWHQHLPVAEIKGDIVFSHLDWHLAVCCECSRQIVVGGFVVSDEGSATGANGNVVRINFRLQRSIRGIVATVVRRFLQFLLTYADNRRRFERFGLWCGAGLKRRDRYPAQQDADNQMKSSAHDLLRLRSVAGMAGDSWNSGNAADWTQSREKNGSRPQSNSRAKEVRAQPLAARIATREARRMEEDGWRDFRQKASRAREARRAQTWDRNLSSGES